MELVSLEEFGRRTMGGRPNMMDVSIYMGCRYECACGGTHKFDGVPDYILRELPGMRLVVACPDGDAVTCIKIRGFFRYRFESLFGSRDETDSSRSS